MELHTKSIISLIKPAEVVCELGSNSTIENEMCAVDCPNCKSTMYLQPNGFVCSSHSCNFKAGSVVDFIAISEQISIKQALDRYCTMFGDKLSKTSRFDDPVLLNETYKHLIRKRRLLEFFIRNKTFSPDNVSLVQANGALRKAGIDLHLNCMSGVLLDSKQQDKLNDILRLYGKSLPTIPQNVAVMAVPYFSNHHTIDAVAICTPTRPKRPPNLIELERNSKLIWSGLLQMHPAGEDVELATSYIDMLRINTKHATTGTGKELAMHCQYRGAINEIGWAPKAAEFILPQETIMHPVLMVAKLQDVIPNLSLKQGSKVVPIREWVLDQCLEGLIEKGLDAEMELQIQAAQLTDTERNFILEKLHNLKKFDVAADLKNSLSIQMIHRDGMFHLFHGPSGYIFSSGDDEKIPITNFTIDLKENLVFADCQDVFHLGTLNLESNPFDIALTPADVDRALDLEAAVRNWVADRGTNKLPTVRDKHACKIITSYLRHKIAEIPKIEGIPFLGWNAPRTRFFGPFWKSNENGCEFVNGRFHPNEPIFNYFSPEHEEIRLLETELPDAMLHVMAQFIGVMTRSYLRLPVSAIPISSDSNHRHFFERLFKGIGQTRPVQLNTNVRTNDMISLEGFCAYATGYGLADAKKRKSSLFCLCEGGTSFVDTQYDRDTFFKAHKTFLYLIFAALEWIHKTNATDFKVVSSVSKASAYLQEGLDVISHACDLDVNAWGKERFFNNLESFLAKVSYDEVNQFVDHDINDHVVTLDLSSRQDIDLKQLERELFNLGAKKVQVDARKVTADAGSILSALESYYDKVPAVRQVFNSEALLSR